MYAVMPQCENIILGGSQDNGYVRILSRLETSNIIPGKVILLQGPSLAPELERFDTFVFPRVKFRELFMEKKLDPGKKNTPSTSNSPARGKSTSPQRPPTLTPTRPVEPELSTSPKLWY